jgi:TRAP-type C4-dicarboxylate transport system permease small subunit
MASNASILVPDRQRHLKWAALDPLEHILMILCGLTLFAFSSSVVFDIVTRTIGRPWLWLQEVTSTFFVYGIFIGAAVASRRNEHLYLTALSDALTGKLRTIVEVLIRIVILGVALSMIVHGFQNFIRGFSSFRMPSLTPIASLYAAIPIAGSLIALFTIEQLINGLKNGFEHPADPFVGH